MGENFYKYWNEMHQKHPDALLLFRHGDFYEVFGTDAVACGKILGIETKQHADRTVTAGFPYHALDAYLPMLIRAGKRVAICDFPIEPPKKRGNNETIETSETKSEKTMAENLKAADLIGKTVTVNGSDAKYVIKSADGDKLMTDFIMGGKDKPIACPITMALLEANIKAGKWLIEGVTPTAAVEEVEEVTDVKPKPAAKTVDIKPEPKPKKTVKPKAEKPEAKTEKPKAEHGKLRYETYVNKKGKTCAKIIGFGENDPAYVNAADLHGSATYERDKDGGKTFYLIFGPRYADAAKEVCDALNAGKTLKDCQAIVDHATEERARQRDEWKQKREERRANTNGTNGYSDKDVAEMLKKIMAGGDIPEDIKKAMAA